MIGKTLFILTAMGVALGLSTRVFYPMRLEKAYHGSDWGAIQKARKKSRCRKRRR